jgi:uncharacterized protein YeaC (DUF1315 family)
MDALFSMDMTFQTKGNIQLQQMPNGIDPEVLPANCYSYRESFLTHSKPVMLWRVTEAFFLSKKEL